MHIIAYNILLSTPFNIDIMELINIHYLSKHGSKKLSYTSNKTQWKISICYFEFL